ncbi:hypothetical protein CONPUDRAFT_158751 [Coniophora puteana RWD-64-598 SS2]|uniref:Uncharacterized protein n=1 Tax=Coniophora puteana (strain RWD-64-598) TaxID=741705 RepID=A0A5M3M9L2_CONPW|nr:uncharacterized protein CONPUDRAFT_158751 [Coniophora puteana RWD-64-598 SS2]EIW75972.1 hypothetical protein CONPUDRAFT_158751 [Coniophora puteana RWD-64-598 SS2]
MDMLSRRVDALNLDSSTEFVYDGYVPVTFLWNILPEAILYGAFAVLLVLDVYVITTRARRKIVTVNKPVLVVVTLMFLVATTLSPAMIALLGDMLMFSSAIQHIVANIYQPYVDMSENGIRLGNIDLGVAQIVQVAAFLMQMWLGDGFMLYRLWKIWDKDKRMLVGFLISIRE